MKWWLVAGVIGRTCIVLEPYHDQIDEGVPRSAVSGRIREITDEIKELEKTQGEFDVEEIGRLFDGILDGVENRQQLADFEQIIIDVGFQVDEQAAADIAAKRREIEEDQPAFRKRRH